MDDVTFTFNARWKEELQCECAHGELILEMPMGIVAVYAPARQTWESGAPAWAVPLWQRFIEQLTAWCVGRNIPLYPGSGSVYFVPVKVASYPL